MKTRTLLLAVCGTFGVLSVAAIAFVAGLGVGKYEIFPYAYVSPHLDAFKESTIDPLRGREQKDRKRISTVFLNLGIETIDIPVMRDGAGGGMTSFGESILLLTHEGTVFRIVGNEAWPTQIEVVDNGFSWFKETTATKYAHLNHAYGFVRYNDVLFYEENDEKILLISYTNWNDQDECYTNSVARLDVPLNVTDAHSLAARPGDWHVVYESAPCLPLKTIGVRSLDGLLAGGRMTYLGDHKIALTNGDYGWDGFYGPEALPLRPDAEYGKVMEIDLAAHSSRIISSGHRNAQGITTDRDGQLWAVEHGPYGGDELNKITEGGNYGWPAATLGTRYNRSPWPSAIQYGRHDNYTRPIYAWVPSIGISNVTLIHGFDPSWDDDLLVASLSWRSLYRMRIKDGRVIFAEPIEIGDRIRYVHQHTDGRIVLWTDSKKVLFLTALALDYSSVYIDRALQETTLSPSKQQRVREAFEACQECHSLETGNHSGAPSFASLYESDVASTAYPAYSDGLKSVGGIWTQPRLHEFLRDPGAFAKGTTMPATGLNDLEVIDGLIAILKEVKYGDHYGKNPEK